MGASKSKQPKYLYGGRVNAPTVNDVNDMTGEFMHLLQKYSTKSDGGEIFYKSDPELNKRIFYIITRNKPSRDIFLNHIIRDMRYINLIIASVDHFNDNDKEMVLYILGKHLEELYNTYGDEAYIYDNRPVYNRLIYEIISIDDESRDYIKRMVFDDNVYTYLTLYILDKDQGHRYDMKTVSRAYRLLRKTIEYLLSIADDDEEITPNDVDQLETALKQVIDRQSNLMRRLK